MKELRVFVAATTQCFPDRPLDRAIEKLADLEFSHIELGIHESSNHLKPSQIVSDFRGCCEIVNSTRRLTVVGLSLEIEAEGDEYFHTFTKCCELAKLSKIVTLTVPSSEHGTPFNEEVERYKELVKIAEKHGVRVAMRNTQGRISADPDTVSVICRHVDGLGLSLDPSHYHFGHPPETMVYENLMEYVHNVYLRDSTPDNLQVRVGQGIIEYGKLINLLKKVGFDRALCVDIQPSDDPDIDHDGELRKLRLLLESLVLV
ncbi:MAG: sugar phosphate isomerase/epimerase [Planctomycetota bacterium]